MITGFSTSPSYLNYASTPKATTAQLITTADAKPVDAAKSPGTAPSLGHRCTARLQPLDA